MPNPVASCLARSSQSAKLPCGHSAAMAKVTDNPAQTIQTRANSPFMCIATPPQHQVQLLLKLNDTATLITDPSLKELLCSGLGRSGLREIVIHGTDAVLRRILHCVVGSLSYWIVFKLKTLDIHSTQPGA